MKLCFVISTLSKGGAERVLSVLANHLSKKHDISILKFDNQKPFYEISPKVKIFSTNSGVENGGILKNFTKRFDKFFKLRKFLKTHEFDFVISFLDYVNILTILANLFLKNRIIISEHTNHTFLKSPVWRILKRLTYPFATSLSVLTNYDLNYYKKFVKNVKILQNPMFEVKNSNLKKENLIISAGRLINFKAFDIFLKAISLVDKELLKNYEIAILGDGEERKNLENLAKNLEINVKFLGFVKDIENYYNKAKIIIVTSRAEGFCNILMESIFFDIARISTDCVAGPNELIKDGFDGYLCRVDDEKEIAKKIEILLKDEEKRVQIIKNARLRKDDFLVENIAKKWIEFLEESR